MARHSEPSRGRRPASAPKEDRDARAVDRNWRELDALRHSRHSFVGLAGGRQRAAMEAVERAADPSQPPSPAPAWAVGLLIFGSLFMTMLAITFMVGLMTDGLMGGARYMAGAAAIAVVGVLIVGALVLGLLLVTSPRWLFATLRDLFRGG